MLQKYIQKNRLKQTKKKIIEENKSLFLYELPNILLNIGLNSTKINFYFL